MDDQESIGARIATERKLRGLTQLRLAESSHISLSLLRKVEQGSKPASLALVSSVARTLGLEMGKLTGQPYYSGNRNVDALHDLIPDLRRELTMYGLPPDEETSVPQPWATLAARAAECSQQIHDVKYARVGELLPVLLADLRAAAHSSTGRRRAGIMLLLRETYDNAKRFAYDLGYPDLGALAVTLEEQAAIAADDPLALGVSRAVRAWTLTEAGAFDAAYRLLVDTVDDLDGDSAKRWSVWGFLHLQAALSRARAGDAKNTWEHYRAAQEATARLETDRDDYGLAFGPTNTAIWGVGLSVELQDGPSAVARAARVVIPEHLPKARAGHHYMDLARGYFYNGDRAKSLDCLLTARKIAPQQTRYHPMARETVYALARAERRSSESLRGLAVWMGVPD
jgi:transcriptional regulator with XRE-family HTH domain